MWTLNPDLLLIGWRYKIEPSSLYYRKYCNQDGNLVPRFSSLRVDVTCKMQTSLDFASLAEKESKLFQVNTDTSGAGILPVNVVYKKSFPAQESQRQTNPKSKMGGKQCFRCGSPRHLAAMCSHVASACNCCGKPGHLAKEHFKKRTKELGGNNTTHQVTATPTSGTCTKEEQENSALSRIVFM